MYKILCSDCYTHIVAKALSDLEKQINDYEKKGYKAIGPAQVVKAEHNDVFAYITMFKEK